MVTVTRACMYPGRTNRFPIEITRFGDDFRITAAGAVDPVPRRQDRGDRKKRRFEKAYQRASPSRARRVGGVREAVLLFVLRMAGLARFGHHAGADSGAF